MGGGSSPAPLLIVLTAEVLAELLSGEGDGGEWARSRHTTDFTDFRPERAAPPSGGLDVGDGAAPGFLQPCLGVGKEDTIELLLPGSDAAGKPCTPRRTEREGGQQACLGGS